MTDTLLKALESLSGTPETAEFACKIQVPSDDLALQVKDVGNIRLPVSATRAKMLIRHAKQAPFGRGEDTVFDKNVRNVWEIAKSRVSIDKRRWNRSLQPALQHIRESLGLPAGRLKAELHKLLIYEQGQFFLPHRDSEKTDAMVASLIVVLPSAHKGGSLIVRHNKRSKRFSIRNPAEKKLNLLAFYADCTHEVKPVTEGYRVALAYNLTFIAANETDVKNLLPEEDNGPLLSAIENFIQSGENENEVLGSHKPGKLVYLLDHHYSAKGLSWARLKSSDRLRAQALLQSARKLDMHAFLTLVEMHELWCAYEPDASYGDGFGPYDFLDDEVQGEEDAKDNSAGTSADYELEELIENAAVLTHWVDGDGNTVRYPHLQVMDDELLWTTSSDQFEPFAEDYEGYMGNYGNTLDRLYHRSAVVLWPKKMHYRALLAMGEAFVVVELMRLARQESIAAACVVAKKIALDWPHKGQLLDASLLGKTLTLLKLLDNEAISRQLLAGFSLVALKPGQINSLLALAEQHSMQFGQVVFNQWTADKRADYANTQWIAVMPEFSRRIAECNSERWRPVITKLVSYFFAAVKHHHENVEQSYPHSERTDLIKQQSSELAALLQSCAIHSLSKTAADIIAHMQANRDRYPEQSVYEIIDSVKHKSNPEWMTKLLLCARNNAVGTLEKHLELPERSPNDWRITRPLNCHCADCQTLQHFLLSSEQKNLDMPLAKARRLHLHRIIDGLELPLSHVTLRQGRPQVLQLRKLQVLFRLEKSDRKQKQVLLAKLRKLRFR